MKRWILALLVAVLVLQVFGCQAKHDKDDASLKVKVDDK